MLLAAFAMAAHPPAAPAPKSKTASKTSSKAPKGPPLTPDERAAQSILKSLSLKDRVAQLLVGVVYGDVPSTRSKEYEKYRSWIHDLHIGGLIVNNRVQYGLVRNAEPHAMALFLNEMQKMSKVPLLVGGDFERGASMRVSDTIRFPFNMAYSAARDVDASRDEGLETAREARALGVQWIFAPDADVNNNPGNPVINLRSFGENPDEVSQHVAAYIDGAHSDPKNPVLVSAKHFPGHGDTNVDSHFDLPRLDASLERIHAMELKPFQAAIAHHVDSIMTAHITAPAVDPDEIPSTVSPRVLTGLLREELGFKGLIVTDAMDMLGLAKQFTMGDASVRAIRAGADVLLMPPDPGQAIRAVVAAVEDGRISRQRIDQSVLRILAAKVHVGLMKRRIVDLDAISDALDQPEAAAQAQSISDRAITLLKNDGGLLPLARANQTCVVVITGTRLSSFGQRFLEEFRRRSPGTRATVVDASLPLAALQAAMPFASPPSAQDADAATSQHCSAIVIAAFPSVGSYANNAVFAGDLSPFVQSLTEGPAPVVLVAFGNPYLMAGFPKAAADLDTFSTALPSETSAVKALFGEIAISGHTPVTIPGFAAYGDGLQLAPRGR